MKLVFPCSKYEKDYYALIESAKKNSDIDEMGNAYREGELFCAMVKRLQDRRNGLHLIGMDVPSTVYFIINDSDHLVGTIDLRHELRNNYLTRLGNVAYYIKKEEREKGYATKALSLALEKYRSMGIYKILITCLKDNIASRKVIENNKGRFESEFNDSITGKIIQRWWIDIDK